MPEAKQLAQQTNSTHHQIYWYTDETVRRPARRQVEMEPYRLENRLDLFMTAMVRSQ